MSEIISARNQLAQGLLSRLRVRELQHFLKFRYFAHGHRNCGFGILFVWQASPKHLFSIGHVLRMDDGAPGLKRSPDAEGGKTIACFNYERGFNISIPAKRHRQHYRWVQNIGQAQIQHILHGWRDECGSGQNFAWRKAGRYPLKNATRLFDILNWPTSNFQARIV